MKAVKDVMIKIVGAQIYSDKEEQQIELVTEAKLVKKDDSYHLVYKETEDMMMEAATTSIKIENDTVKLRRFCEQSSQMIFKKGERTIGVYPTDVGDFTMEILTNEVESHIDFENGKGNLFLKYELSIHDLSESNNRLELSIL